MPTCPHCHQKIRPCLCCGGPVMKGWPETKEFRGLKYCKSCKDEILGVLKDRVDSAWSFAVEKVRQERLNKLCA